VRGILARVNLHMAGAPLRDASRLAEVKKWTKMVMDDAEAGHDLNPSYPQIFINYAQDKYDIKESIWEVELWGNRSDEYTETGNVGYINGPASTNLVTGRGDAYMSITAKHYDAYQPGDLRKGWNIVFFAYDATGNSGSKTYTPATGEAPNEANKFVRHPGKFRREYEVRTPKFPQQTPINMPLLRYADILLMFAEASGPTAEAIAVVNRVRQRSWSTGIKTITVTEGGSGYTTAPEVTFSGNGGAGATATITDGKVTAITLNRDATTLYQAGSYSTPPTITLAGGGGSGATATATIHSKEEASLTAAQTASPEAFLQAIQEERMRELNFEGLRKADLLRWGILVETMQDVGNKFRVAAPTNASLKAYINVEPKHVLMPIPSSETNVNTAIIQNPGWE
jgi:starch-binding outer membrane protein, SusD/RagB family